MPQCNARMLHGAYVESAWRTAQPSALRAVNCVGTCGLLGMRCAHRPKAHLRICFRIGEAIGAIDGELDAVGAYDDALTLLRSEVAAELAAAQVSYAPELWAGAQPGVCPCLHPCRRRRLRLSAHVYASACVVCACVRACAIGLQRHTEESTDYCLRRTGTECAAACGDGIKANPTGRCREQSACRSRPCAMLSIRSPHAAKSVNRICSTD